MSDLSSRISKLSPEQKELLLQRLKKERAGNIQPPIHAYKRGASTLPLSFAQQRLWLLDQLEPSGFLYAVPLAVRLQGSLHVAPLEHSLQEIVRRHETLRTTFTVVEEQPVQVIAPSLKLALPMLNLEHIPVDERESEMLQVVHEEVQRPFDLARGPLLRAILLQLDQQVHVLLLVLHHIVCDGWSRGILFHELTVLYNAFVMGKPSPLPALPIQYADFALWQREWLRDEVLAPHLNYWQQHLAGAPATLQLPTDAPRPSMQTYRGARQYITLQASLLARVKHLCQQEDCTLFMTLLAAFQVLLYRYTGKEDLVVGTAVANRNRAELEKLIGFFLNMLVIRTDLSGNPSFRMLLRRVREVTLNAFAHQDMPFEQLVDALHTQRDLSHSPLFQVVFILQNAPMTDMKLSGLSLSLVEVDSEVSQYDLTLSLVETPQGLNGYFEYNRDLFEASTIKRMIDHWQTILEGWVADPDHQIASLPLLTGAERQQLLLDWNETRREYPAVYIHQLFEAQVERTPEETAVVYEEERLTYRELNQRANQLAHYLRTLGVGSDVLVGICAERSLELVVGLLGILKAGGAYVPLEPGYPQERLAFMLRDTQVPVVLTQQRFAASLPADYAQVLCLDSGWASISRGPKDNLPSGVQPDNLAYVIYTSGSTGHPKGAMNTHGAISNRLLWMQETYQLTSDDRVLQKTPFSFDVSVWEFFWPLFTGARLVMARAGGQQDAAYLVRLIMQQQITTMHFVPSMLEVFLEEPEVERCGSLKLVICSGEALSFALQERFFARLGSIGVRLQNLYGLTETAIDVTFWECEPESKRRTVPIGHLIANTSVYVLDAHLEPVPVGIAGELYIGGRSLARGYLNRPELTAERFIPNPFSTEPGALLYKTGDLARYLSDGAIEYLGRIDHQVKLRGYRIELGEIETVLIQYPAVRENVVIVREDATGDKHLVAYLVPKKGLTPSPSELRSFLKERLPEYMVPSTFVLLEALPLTPNGKVDRRSLPTPQGTHPEMVAGYVAPQTREERSIAAAWQEVLHVEKVGLHDNFFDVGGHSLRMVQVHSKLRKTLKPDLALLDLFKYPTISFLAQHISLEKSGVTSVEQRDDRTEKIKEGKMRIRQRFEQNQRSAKK